MMMTNHKVVLAAMQDSNHLEYFVLEAFRCSELRRRFMNPERKVTALFAARAQPSTRHPSVPINM
jgi:hypothetical protein